MRNRDTFISQGPWLQTTNTKLGKLSGKVILLEGYWIIPRIIGKA